MEGIFLGNGAGRYGGQGGQGEQTGTHEALQLLSAGRPSPGNLHLKNIT